MRTALLTLAYVGLAAYCISDALQHRDHEPYGLPKILWVFIILLFPYIGAAAWIALKFRSQAPAAPPHNTVGPDDDPDYLIWLREQERRRKLGG